MTSQSDRNPPRRGLVGGALAALLGLASLAVAQEFVPNHLFVSGASAAADGAAVFEFAPSGEHVRTIALTPGESGNIYGLAFGPDGALYAGLQNGSLIFRILGDGSFTIFADDADGLDKVNGLAFGPGGMLHAATRFPKKVILLNPEGGAAGEIAGEGGEEPSGLLFGPDGTLLVSMETDAKVVRHAADRTRIDSFGDAQLSGFLGNAAFAPDGRLAVSDYDAGTVDIFSPFGTFQQSLANEALVGPYGLAFGPDGLLYVADFETSAVRVLSLDGTLHPLVFEHEDLSLAAYVAFAPFRFRATVRGETVADSQALARPRDKQATISIAPGSGRVMVALDPGSGVADALITAWHVFHGFESLELKGRILLVHGTEISRSHGGARVGSLELRVAGQTGPDGYFAVKSARGTLNWASAGQIFRGTAKTGKRLK